MDKAGRWEFRAAVILSVVCTALIAYGVTIRSEAGLTREGARWPQERFPLTVEVQAYSIHPEDATRATEVVKDVIEAVNERLGFDALQYTESSLKRAAIHVTIGIPIEVNVEMDVPQDAGPRHMDPGGYYELRGDSGEWNWCIVEVSDDITSDELQFYVLQHEIGHCLGLAHDDYEASIMYPEKRLLDIATMPHISDWDRGLLRKLYVE